MKKCFLLVVILCFGLASTAFAQSLTTKGSIGGTVLDPAGAAVAGATVTITGPKGSPVVVTSNGSGYFEVSNLDPGYYSVSVEQSGFKKTTIEKVEVVVGKQNTVTASLQVGEASAEVVVTDVAQIDQQSTAVSSNLSDQLYENIPVNRNVQSLFYLAPGVTDSGGGGQANPSIAGGSALDNLYIADGVNITDSAFGGLGVFSRVYGTLGTGINTTYIKEVQVKTGGFEPQYGQTTGGIINIITKSGGNEYHGSVFAYARPRQLEAEARHRDDFTVNKVGSLPPYSQLHTETYDAGVEVGGYIPGARDHLFFYGSFNPSIVRDIVIAAHRNQFQIENGAPASNDSGLFNLLGEHHQRYRTLNYALKLDYNVNQNHSINFSLFGDPTKTNVSTFRTLNIDNVTANSALDFGTRNIAVRYNGTFGSTNPLVVSAVVSRGDNHFDELGFADFNQISDRTQAAIPPALLGSFQPRGSFTAVGLGFFEPTKSKTDRITIDVTKQFDFLGSHSLGVGYTNQRGEYSGTRDRSGPHPLIPGTNAIGRPLGAFAALPDGVPVIGEPTNATFTLRVQSYTDPRVCLLCPVFNIPGYTTDIGLGPGNVRVNLRQERGEFGDPSFVTNNKYHSYYVQDTWRFNKYITALLGLRGEQERVIGSAGPNGDRAAYSFTGQWSPRLGVTVDPTGRGKMKVFYNFGRFFEYLPLDLAERSLSAEKDFTAGRFRPDFVPCSTPFSTAFGFTDTCAVVNSFGTVNPIIDAAHLISGIPSTFVIPGLPHFTTASGAGISLGFTGGVGISANDPSNPILAGTKLGYAQEHLIGFETQLPRNFVLSVRYQDRRLKRIVEDAAALSPEQFVGGLFGQAYTLTNVNSASDFSVNPIPHVFPFDGAIPDACVIHGTGNPLGDPGDVPYLIEGVTDNAGNILGSICFDPDPNAGNLVVGGDGIPDGFPDPVHIYRGLEIEVNKRFSENWQLLSNVRFSSLRGNFEGHFRNDNGQTDPGISSLFDFVAGEFNLLGDQFAIGPLNTDRRVVANIYGSYTFGKEGFGSALQGLTLGANLNGQSGTPISEFLAHPAYQNAGEIPVGGRGKLGRTSPYYRLDLHADYSWGITETTRLRVIADVFNVTNNRAIRSVNQNRELDAGTNNVDFFQPNTFHRPFNLRVGAKLEF